MARTPRAALAFLLGAVLLLQEPLRAFAQSGVRSGPIEGPAIGVETLNVGPGIEPGPSDVQALAAPVEGLVLPVGLALDATLAPAAEKKEAARGRQAVGQRLRAVTGSQLLGGGKRISSRGAADAHGLGRDLEDRLTGRVSAARSTLSLSDEPGLAANLAPSAQTRGRGVAVAPEAAADFDPAPGDFAYRKAVLSSFWWYGTERVLKYYRDYKQSVAKNPEPAVSRPRGFIADLRIFGTNGRFNALGFEAGSEQEVEKDALRLYDRYVEGGPEARAAFVRLVERAKTFNPNRRQTNFRKTLRHALMDAATTPKSKLASYYDGRLTAEGSEAIRNFQASEMDRRHAAFRGAVLQALAEEPAGPGRPLAAVLLGSYVSGGATADSDFDVEVITNNGSYHRVPAFRDRLQQLWADLGETAEVGVVTYALPVSGRLLSRIHLEPYEVLTPHPAVGTALASAPSTQSGAVGLWGPLAKRAHWAMAHMTMAVYDGVARLGLGFPDAKSQPDAPRPPPSAEERKAFWGNLVSRTVSISGYIVTMIGFPMIAEMTPGIGKSGFAEIMAFNAIAMIASNPIAGRLVDKFKLRTLMVGNDVLRFGIYAATAVIVAAGWSSFTSLLILSLLNGFNTAMTMTLENKLVSHFWGGDPKKSANVNAVMQLNYLGLQVILGIFLSIGRLADHMGLVAAYGIASGLVAISIVARFITIPNLAPTAKAAAAKLDLGGVLRRHGVWALLFGGSLLAYPFVHSVLPAVGALVLWVATTPTFRLIWGNAKLRASTIFMSLIGMLFFPVQGALVPAAAHILAPAATGDMQGQLLGALFFGQMLASIHLLTISKKTKNWLQAVLIGMVGAWSAWKLFPGSILYAALAMALAGGLSLALSRFTNRTWLQLMGVGLAFVWLPYMIWGAVPMLLSVAMIGLFYSPVFVYLITLFQTEAKKVAPDRMGAMFGVQGALFNAAISAGFAILGIMMKHFTPALPPVLMPLGIAFAVAGLLLAFAPLWFPGLTKKWFSKDGYHHKDPDGPGQVGQ